MEETKVSIAVLQTELRDHCILAKEYFANQKEEMHEIKALLRGNGQEGLTTRVSKLEHILKRYTWFERTVWSALVTLLFGIVLYTLTVL